METEQRSELVKMAAWMRSRAVEVRRHCTARKQAAECMRDANTENLEIAAALSAQLTHRPTKAMTVREAKKFADSNSMIAGRLEAEEVMLLAWAECLEKIAA